MYFSWSSWYFICVSEQSYDICTAGIYPHNEGNGLMFPAIDVLLGCQPDCMIGLNGSGNMYFGSVAAFIFTTTLIVRKVYHFIYQCMVRLTVDLDWNPGNHQSTALLRLFVMKLRKHGSYTQRINPVILFGRTRTNSFVWRTLTHPPPPPPPPHLNKMAAFSQTIFSDAYEWKVLYFDLNLFMRVQWTIN